MPIPALAPKESPRVDGVSVAEDEVGREMEVLVESDVVKICGAMVVSMTTFDGRSKMDSMMVETMTSSELLFSSVTKPGLPETGVPPASGRNH